MLIRRAERFKASDVTDETLYLNRRAFIAGGAAVALGASDVADAAAPPAGAPLKAERNEALSVKDAATKLESATTYNDSFDLDRPRPRLETMRLPRRIALVDAALAEGAVGRRRPDRGPRVLDPARQLPLRP